MSPKPASNVDYAWVGEKSSLFSMNVVATKTLIAMDIFFKWCKQVSQVWVFKMCDILGPFSNAWEFMMEICFVYGAEVPKAVREKWH